jgi:hypothetical protein
MEAESSGRTIVTKKEKLKALGDQLLLCAAIGLAVTVATGFYHRTVLRQHCGFKSGDNSIVDCTLEGNKKGLPLAYVLPNLPNDKMVPTAFLVDVVMWSALPAIFILRPKKVWHG